LEIEHEEPNTSLTDLSSTPRPATAAPDIENTEDAISFNPGAHAAARADGLEFQEEVELNPQDIEQVEVEGLARTQYEGSGMFRLDAPAPADSTSLSGTPELEDSLQQVDLPLIMPDDGAAGRQARQPPAPPRPPVPPPPPPPSASPASSLPAAVALSDDDGAADAATLSQAEPVLTETMAELYLKQGHQQDALRVYQALLAQRPNDAKLRSKVEQLSPGGKKHSGISARGFLKGILSGRGATPVTGLHAGPVFEPAYYTRRVLKLFEECRKQLGDEIELLHDAHERVTPTQAVQFAKDLEKFKLFFLEDVLSPEDIAYFRMIRQQCATPLAMGELFNSPHVRRR
jgi:hypothetical protein